MLNFRLYFVFLLRIGRKKAQNKFLLHNIAKNFVSLQVLKAIITSKNGKMLISGQQAILKDAFFT